MNEFKSEKENPSYPPIDSGIELQVGVVDHAFDVAGIDLDCKEGQPC